MFYVAKGKVYSTEYDSERKVYPEMRLVHKGDMVSLQELETGGSAEKPEGRALCTFEEVVAQLGTATQTSNTKSEPKKSKE